MARSTSGFAVVRWHADSLGYKFRDGMEAAASSVVADACASTPTPPPPIQSSLDRSRGGISLKYLSPMAGGFRQSESADRDPQNSSFGESSGNSEACSFECNICFELARDPVVTRCGHLFCWPCLYRWLNGHSHSSECPVCKAIVEEKMLIPLYGRGDNSIDPRSKSVPDMNIPQRPAGQRPATSPQPDPNQFQYTNPWFMGGAPMASTRFGNLTFSAAIAGLFPLLSFHVHGFPDSTAYGPAAGTPYYNGFHGGHVHRFPGQAHHGQQADVYLKALLFLVGALVITSLVWF
ncbi:hypothetical protein GW17_00023761 [Ensete ventricosum]|nr:hypothetical protein GW17_00023761 [Ensete ventricosum]RZS08093.1 hypothetical protein BHM03_00039025 [Ensete ventricosum]